MVLLLVNNCVIALKNKLIAKVTGKFDLDEEVEDGYGTSYSNRKMY